MLLFAVYYRRCGRNLRAKLCTAINSLSANHANLKTLYEDFPAFNFGLTNLASVTCGLTAEDRDQLRNRTLVSSMGL